MLFINEGHHLSLQRIALDKPRASAVELVMFSTILCFTFFRIRSKVFPAYSQRLPPCYFKYGDRPCFGSAWSLLYLITTSSFVAWIILATSTFVLPCDYHQINMLTNIPKFTLTFVSLIPTSSSPDSRVPSLAAGVLSNTFIKYSGNDSEQQVEISKS